MADNTCNKFARVNSYYDKARYKSLIARENILRWKNTRHMHFTTPHFDTICVRELREPFASPLRFIHVQ